MFDILEMFDKEFTTYIAIISVVSIILLFLIFKKVFLHSSKLRVIFLATIVYVLVAGTAITVYYVSENEYMFSTIEKYHINGKVITITDDYVEIRIASSNLSSMNTGKAKIRLANNTIYSIYANSEETKVNRENINTNSNVEIICKVSGNNQVTALKVTKVIY